MFNIPAANSNPATGNFKLEDLSQTERVVYWTIVLTPLWWLFGIQPLFYPAVITVLLAINFDIDNVLRRLLPACIWAWLGMALVMLWTAMLGINSMGFSFQAVAAALVTFFKSYFLIFECLALPFWSKVRVSVVTRAVSWMATGYLVTIFIEMVLLAGGITGSIVPPLARLTPGDKGSLRIILASVQSFFGIPLPRTVLYTPDPPILGICAVVCLFICLGETNRRLRYISMAGCLCALLLSFSRLAWICLPLALLISTLFRSPLVRQFFLWTASLTFLLCAILGLTFKELLTKPVETFNEARSSSSAERATVVRKTLEAWQQEPWLGWGVIRGAAWLYDDVYMGLGSFSTYAAVLYLHGIVGFIFLILAMFLTLLAFYSSAMRGNLFCQRAFACLLALYLQCNATPLSWMTVNIWFFFLWLGAIIYETQKDNLSVFSWDQLSGQNWHEP